MNKCRVLYTVMLYYIPSSCGITTYSYCCTSRMQVNQDRQNIYYYIKLHLLFITLLIVTIFLHHNFMFYLCLYSFLFFDIFIIEFTPKIMAGMLVFCLFVVRNAECLRCKYILRRFHVIIIVYFKTTLTYLIYHAVDM